MKAVHFGAGNIGRGFIGYLQYKSGYDVTFVDISDFLVDAINKYKNYTVITLSTSENKEEVKNVSAIHLKDIKALEIAVSEADLITTSIGANNLASTGNVLRDLLEKRVQVNKKELDIIACENALFATDILKRSIFDGASIELTEYLQEKVGFPNSAVDRIVPNVNIEKELPIDVAVEDFYEWDIEKDKIKINSEIKGAEYVDKLGPYLERKLFLLNGAHATIAYLGYIKNYKFIHEAVTMDEVIRNAAIGFHNEGIKALSVKHGISVEELKNYSKKIIGRFENSYLQDELSRVGRDPVRKLSANDRLVTPLKLCYELGLEANNILTGIAAGFLFDFEDDEKAQGIQNNIRTNGIVKTVSDVTGLSQDDEVIYSILSGNMKN